MNYTYSNKNINNTDNAICNINNKKFIQLFKYIKVANKYLEEAKTYDNGKSLIKCNYTCQAALSKIDTVDIKTENDIINKNVLLQSITAIIQKLNTYTHSLCGELGRNL